MKEDHRADTMDGCGSRAGSGSRDKNGIPPRPGFREASEDREDREGRNRLQWV